MSLRHGASNPIACVGHGLCAELFPERISLDDWGYPIIDPARSRPPGGHARRAADACPTLALTIDRGGDRWPRLQRTVHTAQR